MWLYIKTHIVKFCRPKEREKFHVSNLNRNKRIFYGVEEIKKVEEKIMSERETNSDHLDGTLCIFILVIDIALNLLWL